MTPRVLTICDCDFLNLPTSRMRFRLPLILQAFRPAHSIKKGLQTEFAQMIRKFPTFHSEREESTTRGRPQIPTGFSRKPPNHHFPSNKNFQFFGLNGKHSKFTFVSSSGCPSHAVNIGSDVIRYVITDDV